MSTGRALAEIWRARALSGHVHSYHSAGDGGGKNNKQSDEIRNLVLSTCRRRYLVYCEVEVAILATDARAHLPALPHSTVST